MNNYKKLLVLNIGAFIEQGLILKPADHFILQWAWDFSRSGQNKTLDDENNTYFWFKYAKCLKDLPNLGIRSEVGVRRRFEGMVKSNWLIPHPNRKGKGSYYAFSAQIERILQSSPEIISQKALRQVLLELIALYEVSQKLLDESAEKQPLHQAIQEIIRQLDTKVSSATQMIQKYQLVAQKVWGDDTFISSKMIQKYQVTCHKSINNNTKVINSTEVIDNKQILSRENFDFLEKLKIRNTELVQEKEREKEIFEKKIQDLEKENESLRTQIQELETQPETSSSPVSKQRVFEIFKNTGCAANTEKFYTENRELIEACLMSEIIIERKAREIKASLQDETQAQPQMRPTDTDTTSEGQTYKLAGQTFEVFDIIPSKSDLKSLVQDILCIQQERDLSLATMQKNLKMYEAFIQTEGVTTNYSLKNWLSGDGNGYGKNWERSLQKAQKNLATKNAGGQASKTAEATNLNYTHYKPSQRPEFYPQKK